MLLPAPRTVSFYAHLHSGRVPQEPPFATGSFEQSFGIPCPLTASLRYLFSAPVIGRQPSLMASPLRRAKHPLPPCYTLARLRERIAQPSHAPAGGGQSLDPLAGNVQCRHTLRGSQRPGRPRGESRHRV